MGTRCESWAVPLLCGRSALSKCHWETGKAKACDDLRVRISACLVLYRLRAMAEGEMGNVLCLCAYQTMMASQCRSPLFCCDKFRWDGSRGHSIVFFNAIPAPDSAAGRQRAQTLSGSQEPETTPRFPAAPRAGRTPAQFTYKRERTVTRALSGRVQTRARGPTPYKWPPTAAEKGTRCKSWAVPLL